MEKLAVVIAILIALTCVAFADQPQEDRGITIIIGEYVAVPENKINFDATGTMSVIPFDFDIGITVIAINGFICRLYGHNYHNDVCKLCGKSKTEMLNRE